MRIYSIADILIHLFYPTCIRCTVSTWRHATDFGCSNQQYYDKTFFHPLFVFFVKLSAWVCLNFLGLFFWNEKHSIWNGNTYHKLFLASTENFYGFLTISNSVKRAQWKVTKKLTIFFLCFRCNRSRCAQQWLSMVNRLNFILYILLEIWCIWGIDKRVRSRHIKRNIVCDPLMKIISSQSQHVSRR